MKIIELKDRAQAAEEGESVLGLADTGSHACYMIYGIVKPGEKERLVKAGKGHEEIVLAMQGDFKMSGDLEGVLKEGQAFHITGETSIMLENPGSQDAVYIISGGHSEGGGHHHGHQHGHQH